MHHAGGGNHEREGLPNNSCCRCDFYWLAFLLSPYKRRFSLVALLRLAQFYIFGSAVPQFWRGLIVWFARDFRDWDAVRGVLLGSVVGLAINIIINVVATIQGWLTANAWGSTVLLGLLLLGGIYQLMASGLGARTLR